MRIACPLLADEHTICGVMIEVDIYPGDDAVWDYPGSGPVIEQMIGPCPHVRAFNNGELTPEDQEALFTAVLDYSSASE